MIYIKIRGGLGNQLFQLAYALAVQKKNNNHNIIIDRSYYNRSHIRNIEIDKLNIPDTIKWCDKGEVLFNSTYCVYRLLDKIKKHNLHLKMPLQFGNSMFLYCDKVPDCTIPCGYYDNIYLAGYFQSEQDVRIVKTDILKVISISDLSNNAQLYLDKILDSNAIAVSIRNGTDYYQMGWPVCKIQYYREALKLFKLDRKIFVFADTIEKVRKENWFSGFDVCYVEGNTPVESLFLMSKCQDFVIANSTFSWWGAYLAENEKKTIIAPEYFYHGIKTRESALITNEMLILDNETGKLH